MTTNQTNVIAFLIFVYFYQPIIECIGIITNEVVGKLLFIVLFK
ncbi:MAG: hypothetical protein N2C13_00270 [Chloroflexota bacterium]